MIVQLNNGQPKFNALYLLYIPPQVSSFLKEILLMKKKMIILNIIIQL